MKQAKQVKVLVAPTAFKGSMSPQVVAEAIVAGLEQGGLETGVSFQIRSLPLADGGDGTLAVTAQALGGTLVPVRVQDALGRPHSCHFLVSEDFTMAELACACGLGLLRPDEYNPLSASTYGLGQVLGACLSHDASSRVELPIICALGGSASTDAGSGALLALGARFYDAQGQEVQPRGGGQLSTIARVDLAPAQALFDDRELIVLTDVTNPLTGSLGAACVYGPQKGATPDEALVLDQQLAAFASVMERACGRSWQNKPGSGAAGGTAFGLGALGTTVKLVSGLEWLATKLELEKHLSACDLVITGEGHFDEQSLSGKVTGRLLAAAQQLSKPIWVLAAAFAPGMQEQPKPVPNIHYLSAGDSKDNLTAADLTGTIRNYVRRAL